MEYVSLDILNIITVSNTDNDSQPHIIHIHQIIQCGFSYSSKGRTQLLAMCSLTTRRCVLDREEDTGSTKTPRHASPAPRLSQEQLSSQPSYMCDKWLPRARPAPPLPPSLCYPPCPFRSQPHSLPSSDLNITIMHIFHFFTTFQ